MAGVDCDSDVLSDEGQVEKQWRGAVASWFVQFPVEHVAELAPVKWFDEAVALMDERVQRAVHVGTQVKPEINTAGAVFAGLVIDFSGAAEFGTRK